MVNKGKHSIHSARYLHPKTRAHYRNLYRSTIIHEFGHVVVSEHFDVPVKSMTLLWENRGQTFLSLEEAYAAQPHFYWCRHVSMIAVAGVAAELMANQAQVRAKDVLTELRAHDKYASDYEILKYFLDRGLEERSVEGFILDVKPVLQPHLSRIIAVAEKLAEDRVWDHRFYKYGYQFDGDEIRELLCLSGS